MKGWVAEHRERIAAQEQEASARIDKMRRQHVQNYRKGFDGFCFKCSTVLREGAVHVEGCNAGVRPDGRPRRLVIHDWEATTMMVEVNGKRVETPTTGWTRRTVRNEEVWTKTVNGVPVLLHHIEAMQAGVVYEKPVDPTSLIPSVTTTQWTKAVAPPRPEYTPRPPRPSPKKASVVNLNQWTIEHHLTKEAERLSAPGARADSLRRQHVLKFAK